MKQLCLIKFGSFLYGTNTEKSDTDYKGVYLPSIEDCILQKISKSINNITKKNSSQKNTKDDIDSEIYSLQHFLKLAFDGETVALDMIHARHTLEQTSPEWEFIYEHRSKFYTKNLKAYLGYCRTQASKYGVKGSRLADAEKVLSYLESIDDKSMKLVDVWGRLPTGENIKFIEIEDAHQEDKRALEVCARKIMASTRIQYAIDVVQKFYNSYGQRAQMAKNNEGIDWKAVSHAFRAGYQLKEIYETGDLKYPLRDAEFIKDIKLGKFHYQNDGIANLLDNLIDNVENLSNKSNYIENVNKKFWEDWILNLYYSLLVKP